MISLEELERNFPPLGKAFIKNMLTEYLHYKILQILFRSKIGPKICFLGGTALRIVYNTSRFSEDLDFDNFGLSFKEFEELSEKVKKELELEGYSINIETYPLKNTFHYLIKIPDILFDYKITGHKNQKLKIKVDTQPHDFKYTPDIKLLNKFDVFANINVAPVDILLSQKITAILGRKRAKGRDFYDVVFLSSKTKPNYDYLNVKENIKNESELKGRLLSYYQKLSKKELEKDVMPFLFNPKRDLITISMFDRFIKEVRWGFS